MKTWMLLLIIVCSASLRAQQEATAMDLANFGLRKEFLDVKEEKNVWILKEHDCPEQVPPQLAQLFASVNKSSQSHLLAMMRGNMRLAVFGLIIPEKQHFQASGMNMENYVAIATCLGGFRPNIKNLDKPKNPYFEQLTAYLKFVKQLEATPYMHMGRELRFQILRQPNDIRRVALNPQLIGGGINIVGGHIFGDYSYIHNKETESEAYRKIVLDNISKLKGATPLFRKEYLDIPILFFTPMAEFRNGFGGDIATGKSRSDSSQLYQQKLPIRPELTKLGKAAIELMLNKEKGHRIAINTNNLSKEGRGWLIDYYKELRAKGDTIPYLMLNSAVHGLSWDNDSINNPDLINSSYFSLVENAVAKEDIEAAIASKGFIGVSLCSDVLTKGTRFERLVNQSYTGSANYKNTVIQVLLSNVLRSVEVAQSRAAWDHIGFSTGFDGLNSYFRGYDNAAEMKNLRADLEAYLENPQAIPGVYTVAEIKELMYDFSAKELTEKLFSLNARNLSVRLLEDAYPAERSADVPQEERPDAAEGLMDER